VVAWNWDGMGWHGVALHWSGMGQQQHRVALHWGGMGQHGVVLHLGGNALAYLNQMMTY